MCRLAESHDLAAIVVIYNQAVAAGFATADTEPIALESQREWLIAHDPAKYPIYVAEREGTVVGWCSLSPYRPGRKALRYTAEISYYVHYDWHRKGVASGLIDHALVACRGLGFKNVFAIVLDRNLASCGLLEKKGFVRWGLLPRIADFDGEECGHAYYGLRHVQT